MSESPGVYSKEKDLTFTIQSITSNAGAYVGMFRWGPVDQIVSITSNEQELALRFGQPDAITTGYWHAAANYLLYSVPLHIVRVVGDETKNAITEDAIAAGVLPPLVKNNEHAESVNLDGMSFVGKYPGDLANTLKISASNSAGYATWEHADEFEFAPAAGQINVVVIDEGGLITGSAGAIVERYELMSLVSGSRKTDGTAAYLPEVLNAQSQYIMVGDVEAIDLTTGTYEQSFAGGVDDNVATTADFVSAWDLYANVDSVEFTRAFTAFNPVDGVIRAIDVCDTRTDAIVFHACRLDDIYNTLTRTSNLTTYFGTTINKPTSYAFQVDNWKLVNDKFNDKSVWIPCDSDAAGLHARVFVQNEPWFSPAGLNRGHLKNVIRLAWSSQQVERDLLYKNSINSIVSFKGEGNVLFGDKTALRAPSAFRFINVRTLFIVIRKAISTAARYQLFELNDFITQSLFRNATERYLEDVKSRRGIYDKKVVCDSSNNTPQVVDSNEFVGDIYVKPARSINVIRLNFIAVGTGVEFAEVEGA